MLGYVNLKLYEAFICYLYAIIGSICCSICTCSSVFQGGHLGHHGYHWYIYIYTTDITYLEFGSMAIPGTNLLEVPIIYNAYVSKGIYHQNMALHGTVPPFRILEFPLIVRRSFQSAGGGLKLAPSDRNGFHFHLLVDKRTAGLFCKVDSENLILTNSTFSRGWRI